MIPKREILDVATQTNLLPAVVEKDYVLGWLLAGINQSPALRDLWVFKGGTCLKKCYFDTYRFSEDLDFSLRDPAHIDENFLIKIFTEIAAWIYDNSGIEIPTDRIKFEIHRDKACQGRIYYRGPVTPISKQAMPRIKLDLTANELIVEPSVLTAVRHDYSDKPTGGICVESYSYVEVFAEKIRALKERTRPRDLYDVINFFRRPESHDVAAKVREVLKKKCAHKNIKFPLLSDLDAHKEACAAGWREQLAHQLPSLPPFESFWDELPAFFLWLDQTEKMAATVLATIPLGTGEILPTDLWRVGVSAQLLHLLDSIRFAAVNRLCIELDYMKKSGERKIYLIEPYSLRVTFERNLLLYGVKLTGKDDKPRNFRIERIMGVKITGQAFTPRYEIDFIPEGPVLLTMARKHR